MNYYDEQESRSKLYGGVATALYAIVLCVAMLWVDVEVPLPVENSMLVIEIEEEKLNCYYGQHPKPDVVARTSHDIMESITNVIYDPTIFIKTKTYGDEIRTFCTNPGGFVAKENYYGYICVNGHALKEKKSNNSNFAFIVF